MKITNQANGMKSIFKTPIIALVAVVVFSLWGCGTKNPFEGLKLLLDAGAVVSPPSTFFVLDAETGLPDPAFNNMTVTVTGDATEYVYNSAGKQEFKIINGVIQTAFSMVPNGGYGDPKYSAGVQNITEAAPWKYNLVIKVPGYDDMIYPVIATSPYPTVHEIYLLKKDKFLEAYDDLVDGQSVNGKVTVSNKVGATASGGYNNFILNINETLKDKDGNLLSGKITASGSHTLPYFLSNSKDINFLKGFNMAENTILDKNGQKLEETNIFPFCVDIYNIQVDGKDVYDILPANVNNPINKNTLYLHNGKISLDEELTLLSKRPGTNVWVKEQTFKVANKDVLFCPHFIYHPGTWVIAKISKPVYLNVETNYSYDGQTNFFTTINGTIDYFKPDGSLFYSERLRATGLNKEGSVRFPVKPFMPMKLRDVMINTNFQNDGLLYWQMFKTDPMPNSIIPTANANISLPYSLTDRIYSHSSVTDKVKYAKFRGVCSNSTSKYVVLPLFYPVYYIEDTAANTTPLYKWKSFEASVNTDGQWNFGTVPIASVETGKSYRFKTIYNNKEYIPDGTIKDSTNSEIQDIEFKGLPCGQ